MPVSFNWFPIVWFFDGVRCAGFKQGNSLLPPCIQSANNTDPFSVTCGTDGPDVLWNVAFEITLSHANGNFGTVVKGTFSVSHTTSCPEGSLFGAYDMTDLPNGQWFGPNDDGFLVVPIDPPDQGALIIG